MTISVVLSGSFLAYQYVNLISLCLVFSAVEIKKRKKVSNWLFLMRRLSSSSDVSAASEPEVKTSLFEQPLSAICSDGTLPGPIQVGARSPRTSCSFLWKVLGKPVAFSCWTCWGAVFRFFLTFGNGVPTWECSRENSHRGLHSRISCICQWAQVDGPSILLT